MYGSIRAKLKQGETILNSTRDKTERIGRILRLHANKREESRRSEAGDICAIVGLKDVVTGNTLAIRGSPMSL